MDVSCYKRCLNECVVSKHVLLTGLSGLSLNGFLYCVTVLHLASLESLKVCRAVGDGYICDSVSKSLEGLVAGNEVSLAAEAYEYCLVSGYACLYGTLRCLAVSSLGCYKLTFLADDAHCLVEVSLSFLKSLLAVHHTG